MAVHTAPPDRSPSISYQSNQGRTKCPTATPAQPAASTTRPSSATSAWPQSRPCTSPTQACPPSPSRGRCPPLRRLPCLRWAVKCLLLRGLSTCRHWPSCSTTPPASSVAAPCVPPARSTTGRQPLPVPCTPSSCTSFAATCQDWLPVSITTALPLTRYPCCGKAISEGTCPIHQEPNPLSQTRRPPSSVPASSGAAPGSTASAATATATGTTARSSPT